MSPMRVIDAGAATLRRNDSTVTSRAEGHQANLDRNYLFSPDSDARG
jgi:hypothetical protein